MHGRTCEQHAHALVQGFQGVFQGASTVAYAQLVAMNSKRRSSHAGFGRLRLTSMQHAETVTGI